MRIPTIILAATSILSPAAAITPSSQLTAKERTEVVESIKVSLNENYVFPEVALKCTQHLKAELEAGRFGSVTDKRAFANQLTEVLQAVTNDLHLRIVYAPQRAEIVREDPRLAAQQQYEQSRQQNFGFERLERLNGNIGYLELRSFADLDSARDTAAAAMGFLANSDGIIIDLRRNGGGSPEMVQFLCSYLFAERTHLNSLYWRPTDHTEEYWTLDKIPGPRMPDVPVYILTSQRTFSAAEEFSYNLSTQDRATVVGETTGGGAHPGDMQTMSHGFRMFVPSGRAINPITGTNWEGIGVKPDVEVAQDLALDIALKSARVAAHEFRLFREEIRAENWEVLTEQIADAEAAFKRGNMEAGKRLIEAALSLGLEQKLHSAGSIDRLGAQCIEQGDLELGLAVLRFNAEQHPVRAEVWNSLGLAHLSKQQEGLARRAFETCLRISPTHAEAAEQLAKLTE